MTSKTADRAHVTAVRAFNRFYTKQIGLLDRRYLGSSFSLTETRVLFELRHHATPPTASDISLELGIDPGYLSRLLRDFARRGLVRRTTAHDDARRTLLSLTARGRRAFDAIDREASRTVGALLTKVPPPARGSVVDAMRTVQSALGDSAENRAFTLRTHRPGDMGWVTHRQGLLYAQEYGWDERFEALCARICAEFIDHFDARRERCWLAERDRQVLGSIFCVRKSKTVAKLRLLYVEPAARGMGIGKRLVDECIRFARAAGYRTLTLWTQNNLHAARHLYVSAGFKLVSEEKHFSFGKHLVAQNWDLAL